MMDSEEQYAPWGEHAGHFGQRAPVVHIRQSYATDDHITAFRVNRQFFGGRPYETYPSVRVVSREERAPGAIRDRRAVEPDTHGTQLHDKGRHLLSRSAAHVQHARYLAPLERSHRCAGAVGVF